MQRELEPTVPHIPRDNRAPSYKEHPVQIPIVYRRRVMNSENVDVFDLPAGGSEVVYDSAERGGGAREDVSVHEDAPD